MQHIVIIWTKVKSIKFRAKKQQLSLQSVLRMYRYLAPYNIPLVSKLTTTSSFPLSGEFKLDSDLFCIFMEEKWTGYLSIFVWFLHSADITCTRSLIICMNRMATSVASMLPCHEWKLYTQKYTSHLENDFCNLTHWMPGQKFPRHKLTM